MQHTQNYQLSRWEKDDRIMMEDFNADNEKIDAALKAANDRIDIKADAAALSDETGARTAADSSFAGQLAELAANLGVHGYNCRIATGSYVGTGGYGESNPNSLSFNMNPLIVVIASRSASEAGLLVAPVTGALFYSGYTRSLEVTWSGKTVSWYTSTTTNAALAQLNSSNTTYYWVALGYDDE